MSSLTAKDRVSLCSFSFSDGRRCRSPRISNHPSFCFYHAQKEARALAAQKLGKDLAYFFSGDYLSACDLSSALSRLIPTVVRGDVKPKTAHTVAYLVQTLVQAIHISQHEYINAFGTDGWRKSVRNSVKGNYDYLFPPDPEAAPEPVPSPAPVAHPLRGKATSTTSPRSPVSTQAPPTPASAPSPTPAQAPQTPAAHTASFHTAEIPVSCHSERSEESAFFESQAALSQPIPATQPARSTTPAAPPESPQQTSRSAPQPSPNRDAHAVHFDHTCRLLIDGKPF